MKKKIALLLTLTTVASAFSGCGNTTATSEEDIEGDTTASANTESESTESTDDVWELDGYTYEIPPFWTDLEVNEGGMVDSELSNKILEADKESEYGIDDNQILSVIYDVAVGDINTKDYQDCYEKLMENLGNPIYAAINVYYVGDDIKNDYEKTYYLYHTYYLYQFDDDTYLKIFFIQQPRIEDNFKYPEIDSVSIISRSELEDIGDNYIRVTDVNSSYAKYVADEKGSY